MADTFADLLREAGLHPAALAPGNTSRPVPRPGLMRGGHTPSGQPYMGSPQFRARAAEATAGPVAPLTNQLRDTASMAGELVGTEPLARGVMALRGDLTGRPEPGRAAGEFAMGGLNMFGTLGALGEAAGAGRVGLRPPVTRPSVRPAPQAPAPMSAAPFYRRSEYAPDPSRAVNEATFWTQNRGYAAEFPRGQRAGSAPVYEYEAQINTEKLADFTNPQHRARIESFLTPEERDIVRRNLRTQSGHADWVLSSDPAYRNAVKRAGFNGMWIDEGGGAGVSAAVFDNSPQITARRPTDPPATPANRPMSSTPRWERATDGSVLPVRPQADRPFSRTAPTSADLREATQPPNVPATTTAQTIRGGTRFDSLLDSPADRLAHARTARIEDVTTNRNGRAVHNRFYVFPGPARTNVHFYRNRDNTYEISMSAAGVGPHSSLSDKASSFADAMSAIEHHADANGVRRGGGRYLFSGETNAHVRLFRALLSRVRLPKGAVVYEGPAGFEISFNANRPPMTGPSENFLFDPNLRLSDSTINPPQVRELNRYLPTPQAAPTSADLRGATQPPNVPRFAPSTHAVRAEVRPGRNPGSRSVVVTDPSDQKQYFFTLLDGENNTAFLDYPELPRAARGRGLGIRAYEAAIVDAEQRGRRFVSGPAVSRSARRVYDALRRRGYNVTENTPSALSEESFGEVTPGFYGDEDGATPLFGVSPPRPDTITYSPYAPRNPYSPYVR